MAAVMPAAMSFVLPAATGNVTYATSPSAATMMPAVSSVTMPVGGVTYAAAPSATMMPATSFAAPTVVYAAAPSATVMPALSSVTMPAGGLTYAAAPITTYAAASIATSAATSFGAPITTYAAAPSATYAAAPITSYAAAPTVTYAAPATYGAAPLAQQPPSFTISPERFQRIMGGQPLTQEEIAAMTTTAQVTNVPQVASVVATAASAVVNVEATERAINKADPMTKEISEGHGFLQFLDASQLTVQAERVPDNQSGKEAFATLPIELTGVVPEDYKQGDKIIMPSPAGDLEVDAPPNTQPGTTVRYRLAPTPELRVKVPPGKAYGELVSFRRADGLEIEVPVPEGLREGDYFDVDPPALMVRVPADTGAGEAVVFPGLRRDGQVVTEWCRAVVPQGIASGKFFVARLPPPLKPDADDSATTDSKKGAKTNSKKKMSSKKKDKSCC